LLFTIRATMVKLVDFSEKEGHNRLLSATLIRARLDVMFARHSGPDGQVFAGEHDCMLRFGPYDRDIFERVHTTGKPQPKTRGFDVQQVLLLVPFLLDYVGWIGCLRAICRRESRIHRMTLFLL